jgi:hypothetical protein
LSDAGGPAPARGSRPATRLATCACAAFLAWNAGALARGTWSELAVPLERWRAALTLDERERVERWLAENEPRYGFRPGWPLELLRLIERAVPADSVVHVLGSFREPAAGVFPMLQALCQPRLFEPLFAMPADWPRSPEDYDPRVHVLAFGAERPADLSPAFVRVESGVDWDLWRCREGPP